MAGRESRRMEPMPTSLHDVAAGLAAELAALEVPRIALFGHCSGALIAFEAARELRRYDKKPQLMRLIVASQLPPADVAGDSTGAGQDPFQYVPDDLREEPEMVELLLPVITADMRIVAGYTYRQQAPLEVPLTVLHGADDRALTAAAMDDWRRETTGSTDFHEVAGADHLFSGDAWLTLAETIATAIDN